MQAEEPSGVRTRAEVPTYTLRVWVVPVRLLLGAMWLWASIEKMNPNLGGIRGIVTVMARGNAQHPEGNPISFFRVFLESVVLPNWQIFGVLILLGELIVGLALILGAATRAFALLGIFLQITYWIGRGYLEWPFTYPTVIAAHILLILTCAGRSLGVDTLLARRKPQWPIW